MWKAGMITMNLTIKLILKYHSMFRAAELYLKTLKKIFIRTKHIWPRKLLFKLLFQL